MIHSMKIWGQLYRLLNHLKKKTTTHFHFISISKYEVSRMNIKGVCVCVCVYACARACTRAVLTQLCLFVTLWTVAHQASLSMGFFRQEY